jgi:hypothetical protein
MHLSCLLIGDSGVGVLKSHGIGGEESYTRYNIKHGVFFNVKSNTQTHFSVYLMSDYIIYKLYLSYKRLKTTQKNK